MRKEKNGLSNKENFKKVCGLPGEGTFLMTGLEPPLTDEEAFDAGGTVDTPLSTTAPSPVLATDGARLDAVPPELSYLESIVFIVGVIAPVCSPNPDPVLACGEGPPFPRPRLPREGTAGLVTSPDATERSSRCATTRDGPEV